VQTSHAPEQAALQQTLSAQKLDRHCWPVLHALPSVRSGVTVMLNVPWAVFIAASFAVQLTWVVPLAK
jgi:hypothetical protein